MNLAKHGPAAGYGALLGALGGFLLNSLGVPSLFGDAHAVALVVAGLIVGAAIAVIAGTVSLACANALLVLLWLAIAYTPMMARLAPAWVRQDSAPASANAVVVLSSGVGTDSALTVDGLDRLISGLAIAKSSHAGELVTSRVARLAPAGVITSDSDQARLVALAGYSGHWDIVTRVHSTRDEALRAARLLLPARPRIVLVTSPMHTRRACATFERVGFIVSCQPAREHEAGRWHPVTSTDRLAAFGEYAYERLGMLKYRAKGWVAR